MPSDEPCVACGRSNVPLEHFVMDRIEMVRCVNPTDCRRHWPEEDRQQVARMESLARHPSRTGTVPQ